MSFTNPTQVKANPYALIPADNFVPPKFGSGQYIGVEPIASLAFGIVANTDLAYVIDLKSVTQLNAVKALMIDARFLNIDILVQIDDSIGVPFYVRRNTLRQFNVPAINTKRIKISVVPLQTDSYGQFNNLFGNCVVYAFNYSVAETISKRRGNYFICSAQQAGSAAAQPIIALSCSNPSTIQAYLELEKIVITAGNVNAPVGGTTTVTIETNVLNPYTLSSIFPQVMTDSSVQLSGIGIVRSGQTAAAPNGTIFDSQTLIIAAPYEFKFSRRGRLRLPGPQAGASIIGSVVVRNNNPSASASLSFLNATFFWKEFNDNTVSQ